MKAKCPVFHFLDLAGTILNLIKPKIKTSKFLLFFKVILILPPAGRLNLGLDLSIDNIVRLDSADTKIISQDAVNKVLKLTEK